MNASKWLSAKEVAEYLGIKQDTLYKWINRGKGVPAHKVGGLWKFKAKEIDKWIESK